jgi:hypothetical protein
MKPLRELEQAATERAQRRFRQTVIFVGLCLALAWAAIIVTITNLLSK